MKKQKKFSELSSADANSKYDELVKELVKFRVSMDPSVVTTTGGFVALKRDLKVLSRQKFQTKK